MIELNRAYQCEYCGKIFATKGGTHTHERHCRRNERNARACYTCKHYDDARDRPNNETNPKEIIVKAEFEMPVGMYLENKVLSSNLCKADKLKLRKYESNRNSNWRLGYNT